MIELDELIFFSRGRRHQPVGILHDLGFHIDPARRFPLAFISPPAHHFLNSTFSAQPTLVPPKE